MIKGVLAILKSGLLIAQKGFKETENILPPLMAAVLNLSEALGAGNVESLELSDLKVYIVASRVNPDVIVAIVAQKSANSFLEMLAKNLITKIDKVITADMEVVTNDIVTRVEEILSDFMKKEARLPSVKQIVEVAKVVYGNLPTGKVVEIERKFKEFIEREEKDEISRVHKVSIVRVNEPGRILSKAIENAYSWNLLRAFDLAYSLAMVKDGNAYSWIGRLLAIKIGLITRKLPPGHNIIGEDIIKELMKDLGSGSLPNKFIMREVNSFLHNEIAEWVSFLREKNEEIAELIENTKDESVKQALAFIFYSPSRYVVGGPIGEVLVNVFREKSSLLYEYLVSLKELVEIFRILYSPKGWVEVQKRLANIRTKYLEMKKKLEDQLKKFILVRILQRDKLVEISFSLLSRLQPYLLSVLAAIESYGLPINDRHAMLKEAYETVMSDVYYLVDANPPLDITVYFYFYQFLLHMLYYLTYFTTGDELLDIWKDALMISAKGVTFFSRLFARGRIRAYNFLSYSSPLAFILAKASMNLGDIPDELLFYLRALAFLSDDVINELEKVKENQYAFVINSIFIMTPLLNLIQLGSSKEYLSKELVELLEQTADWTIMKGTFSREMVDNFGDAVEALVKNSNDRGICKEKILRLVELIDVLIKDPEESEFEMAIVAPKLGKVVLLYTQKFGVDEFLLKEARRMLTEVIKLWDLRGYKEKVNELNSILQELSQIIK